MAKEGLVSVGVVVDRDQVWRGVQRSADENPGDQCLVVVVDDIDVLALSSPYIVSLPSMHAIS